MPKFESSFTGLDLSEFSSSSEAKPISASAQLLQLKKEEGRKQQIEDEEEALVQQHAAKKAQDQLRLLQQEDEKLRDEKESGNGSFLNALISMHGTDHSGGQREKGRTKKMKTKAQKRTMKPKFKAGGSSRIPQRKHSKSRR